MGAVLTLRTDVKGKLIRVWFPAKYVPVDGYIDGEAVQKDGFEYLFYLGESTEGCLIDSMKRSPTNGIIVEILSLEGKP